MRHSSCQCTTSSNTVPVVKRSCLVILAMMAFGLAAAQSVAADPVTIDFEGFGDGTSLTNQVSGITFSNAIVLTAGQSLNEAEVPPHSGFNVVSDDGGPLSINFASPTASFSGYFTYAVQITLEAYDSSNNLLGSINSLFSNNFLLSGDAGSTPGELLSFSFAQGISRIVITGDPGGASFVLDDMTIQAPVEVPEPASVSLLALGSLALAAYGRRRLIRLKF